MSHDQRPARVRVVAAPAPDQRREDPATASASGGDATPGAGAPAPVDAASTVAGQNAFSPILAAILFLIACAGGGFGAVFLLRGMGAI